MMLETPSKQVAGAGTVVCTGCTCARLVLGSFERVEETRCPSRAGEWEEPVAKEGHHPWQGLTTLSRTERHFPGPPDAAGRLRDPEPVLTIRLAGVCAGTDSSAAHVAERFREESGFTRRGNKISGYAWGDVTGGMRSADVPRNNVVGSHAARGVELALSRAVRFA